MFSDHNVLASEMNDTTMHLFQCSIVRLLLVKHLSMMMQLIKLKQSLTQYSYLWYIFAKLVVAFKNYNDISQSSNPVILIITLYMLSLTLLCDIYLSMTVNLSSMRYLYAAA